MPDILGTILRIIIIVGAIGYGVYLAFKFTREEIKRLKEDDKNGSL